MRVAYEPSVMVIKVNKSKLLGGNSAFEVELAKQFRMHKQSMLDGNLSRPIAGEHKDINVIDEVLAFSWAFRDAMSRNYA